MNTLWSAASINAATGANSLPYESDEMRGILAYIWGLSRDVPTGVAVKGRGFMRVRLSRPADPQRGESVYVMKCAACHGSDRQGRRGANGDYLFPALWGPESFNTVDVAAYFIRQPRPDLPAKMRDWPKGGKPDDARY